MPGTKHVSGCWLSDRPPVTHSTAQDEPDLSIWLDLQQLKYPCSKLGAWLNTTTAPYQCKITVPLSKIKWPTAFYMTLQIK